MRSITLPERDIPVIGDYDVVVAGGGPGGIPAAVAAARSGAKTLLIERYGYLGGMATAGLINVMLGVRASGTDEPMIGGIAEELCREMAALGAASDFDEGVRSGGIYFAPEAFKLVADVLVEGASVDLRLHSWVSDTTVEDGRVSTLMVESKSGREAVTGRVFVDATGDADVVEQSGARFTHGREFDGAVQAMGSMFRLGGVDEERLPADEERAAIMQRAWEAIDAGEISAFNPSWGWRVVENIPGERMVNAMRFAGDPCTVEDLTAAEVQVRRDTWALVEWWRENVPGLENAYLVQTPPHVGIRESRQVVGHERITGDDVLAARRHEDAVARGSYYIDIHCPLGRVRNSTHLCYKNCPNDPPCAMYEERYEELPGRDEDAHKPMRPRDGLSSKEWDRPRAHPRDGLWFDIPWGCLVSADIPNLLCAGRNISCDHKGMAAMRVMGSCMAIGQAAGEGAAMAADADCDGAAVDVHVLQERLRANGAAC
ncbi:MAG: FAD-dependent oxidoreductase [Armatimonadota bacterium]